MSQRWVDRNFPVEKQRGSTLKRNRTAKNCRIVTKDVTYVLGMLEREERHKGTG